MYAPVYLSRVIQKCRHQVVGITALSAAGRQGWIKYIQQRLKMYGLREFLRAVFLYVGCRLRSLLPASAFSDRLFSVRQVASRYNIPTYPCDNVNDPSYIERLKQLEPDLIVSIAANQRFEGRLLNTPRLACLNIHSALLPKYRGMDGLFWALAHGDSEVGVTVHLMNEAFDAGDIIAQQATAVAENDTLHSLYFKVMEIGSSLLAGVVEDFASCTVSTTPNDLASGSYFSAPTPEAVRQFRKLGRRFF